MAPPIALLLFSLLFSPLLSSAIPTPLQGLHPLAFDDAYTQIFGDGNLAVGENGKAVHIALDRNTGAGFASQDLFLHGFFSASVKLPAGYAAGVVVAFYMSNGDVYEKNHDELDFEFLGNVRGREWRVQTNVYGNGSTKVGREERYDFWFDPTEDFHNYSILWNHDRIIFYIDSIPIREVVRSEAMGGAFPSKPMSLYATIWDGSSWATLGGRYKVDYKRAPYIAKFDNLVLHGCAMNPIDLAVTGLSSEQCQNTVMAISPEQRAEMAALRSKCMTYSYCHDRIRYPRSPPECDMQNEVTRLAYHADGIRVGDRQHRGVRGRRRGRNTVVAQLT